MKAHFVGIGGIGMSGIALMMKKKGYSVSGSDIEKTSITEKLEKAGIRVRYGHSPSNVAGADFVVFSSAVSPDNPEILEAERRKIPLKKRAQALSELVSGGKLISVSGSHGKTTTTSMISSVFERSGLDYSAVVGGIFRDSGSNVRFGGDEYFICEADESDASFLYFNPLIACVTSIDSDHLDHYGGMERIKEAFLEHINKVPFYGRAILCADDKGVSDLLDSVKVPFYTYGAHRDADFRARRLRPDGGGTCFAVFFRGKMLGEIKINPGGRHNVLNALCAAAACSYAGIGFETVKEALSSFPGVKRRMEEFGFSGGVRFMDDYAHHPSEISNLISAVKETFSPKRIIILFQPHRYTRTKILHREISSALSAADRVYIADIYPAGEKKIPGVSSGLILENLANGEKFAPSQTLKIAKELRRGDIFISMGAGDVWKAGREIKMKRELLF